MSCSFPPAVSQPRAKSFCICHMNECVHSPSAVDFLSFRHNRKMRLAGGSAVTLGFVGIEGVHHSPQDIPRGIECRRQCLGRFGIERRILEGAALASPRSLALASCHRPAINDNTRDKMRRRLFCAIPSIEINLSGRIRASPDSLTTTRRNRGCAESGKAGSSSRRGREMKRAAHGPPEDYACSAGFSMPSPSA